MAQHKAARIRLYPTPEQARAFERIAGCCRLVYNLGLEQRRDFWRQHKAWTGSAITWISQKREITDLKVHAPFLTEAPVHCLQMALKDLDAAYARFFAGISGCPRPRKKRENDSFTFPDPAQIQVEAAAGRLILPKFGRRAGDNGFVAARYHRPLHGELRRVTISREGRHWYASILMRTKRSAPRLASAVLPEQVVAVDCGVTQPFTTSDGCIFGRAIEGPRQLARQRRLARALARTQRGSRRRNRARLRLLAHKSKMARRRRDMIHQVTNQLAKNHRVIVIEALRTKAMTASGRGTVAAPGRNVAQKAGLNRAILDKGWGEFRRQLQYKLAWSGGLLLEVPARDTSRTCAACAHVDAASRISRDHFRCVACGHSDNADVNAAIEIRRRGLALLRVDARPERSCQPGEPSAQARRKREERNDGINASAPADA